MTRSSVVAAVVVTLLLGLLIWWRDEHSGVQRITEALTPPSKAVPRSTGKVTVVPAVPSASPGAVASTEPPEPPAAAPRPYEPPPMTDAMRERRRRVLDSPGARAPAAYPAAGAAAPAALEMKDQTGRMRPAGEPFDEHLLPLVDRCVDQAKQRGVHWRGMLALEVKLAGAEGVGRIVESVEAAPDSGIQDAELIDCVRQSAFTLDLPPPASSGSSEIMMTIPLEVMVDAGAPTSK